MLYRDAAGFIEQLLPFAGMHNQRIDLARYRAHARQLVELLLLGDVIDGERDIVRDFLQQQDFFITKEIGFMRIEHEYPCYCLRREQGQRTCRVIATPPHFLRARAAHARPQIVVEHRLALAYGAADMAISLWKACPCGGLDELQMLGVDADPGNWRDLLGSRIE